MSVPEGILPFQVAEDTSDRAVTSFAGLPLVIETFRALGLDRVVKRHVRVRLRDRGFKEVDLVETLTALMAAGGDCVDDVRVLAADPGLRELWRRDRIPSPSAIRRFLDACHDDSLVMSKPGTAHVPEPTAPVRGLGRVNRELVRRVQQERHEAVATIDIDATLTESAKQQALPCYEGYRAYQPIVALWAELGLVIHDEFRDGNVPAGFRALEFTKEALAELPEGLQVRVRSDSAFYDHRLLQYLRRRPNTDFAISADMSPELRAQVEALGESAWKPLRTSRRDGLVEGRKEWAEVEFVPDEAGIRKDEKPDRYLAIRVRPAQGELFADGNAYHYYAVVTSLWDWDGEHLLRWQRERCGTVEQTHDVVKNELGGGVLPSKRFGANAAWWRLAVLTYNLLGALKLLALPAMLRDARPKRLRFVLFRLAGRVIEHARRLWLKLPRGSWAVKHYRAARLALAGLAPG
jgi:hypothetical protein